MDLDIYYKLIHSEIRARKYLTKRCRKNVYWGHILISALT